MTTFTCRSTFLYSACTPKYFGWKAVQGGAEDLSPHFSKASILLEKIASSACGRVYGLFFFTVNSVLKHVMVIRETPFCVFLKGMLLRPQSTYFY
jgi:hypothetical protein